MYVCVCVCVCVYMYVFCMNGHLQARQLNSFLDQSFKLPMSMYFHVNTH